MIENDLELNAALSKIIMEKRDAVEDRKSKLSACISLGAKLSQLEAEFPSTKLRGPETAKRFPDSQSIASADRTRYKWLYEALHKPGHAASDILQVLDLQTISDICKHTWHPTVIFRHYMKAKAQAA